MRYYPTLKTTDSELRAVQYLSAEVKSEISPVFELTRSRKTKKDPEGSVLRRISQLKEIYGDGDAILDITTVEELLNSEMDALFDEAEGYSAWCSFAFDNFPEKYCPCVQYVENGSEENFKLQARTLLKRFGKVALRLSVKDAEAEFLYNWLVEEIGQNSIILIANAYFIEQGMLEYYENLCASFLTRVIGNRLPATICFPCSSFPRAVGVGDYGDDDGGSFQALELQLFERLKKRFPSAPIAYSDYASVHPIRYPTSFGNWVPRIDIPFNGSYSFARVRREQGGYAVAAGRALSKFGKSLVNCWGSDQIRTAAAGHPPGGNPSFWISTRINQWITQRVSELN